MAIAPLFRLTPEDTERTIGPVHMQPKTLLGTEIGQCIEWINGAGIDPPSTANDTKWLKALILVGNNCITQGVQVYMVPRIERDETWFAKTQQVRRLAETAMSLFRDVEHQLRMVALQSLSSHIPARLCRVLVASHRQAVERCHRATTDQNASATINRKVDQFHEPAHHAVLNVDCGVVSSGCARIHHVREKLSQHTDGCACRVDPGGETRMLVDRDTGAENGAIEWGFTVGDRVKIRLVNEMDTDHPMHHPFHIHGAGRFLILSRDGVVEPNLVWKDTVLVRKGQTVDILLDVSNPGLWMAHCHIAEHMQSGMMFSFNVARAVETDERSR